MLIAKTLSYLNPSESKEFQNKRRCYTSTCAIL